MFSYNTKQKQYKTGKQWSVSHESRVILDSTVKKAGTCLNRVESIKYSRATTDFTHKSTL